MATVSTIPAVKAALVARLTARINDASAPVVWGRPPDSLVVGDMVYVADVRLTSEIANIKTGRKQRDEEYTVEVVVSVYRTNETAQVAETRAYALLAALEDELALDPLLADGPSVVDGIVSAVLDTVDATTTANNGSPVVLIVAGVAVHARLV